MLDQPVPNPLAKNPNIHTHKVFASIGLVLIGTIITLFVLLFGSAYVFGFNVADLFSTKPIEETTNKVSTSSAYKTTSSETKDETSDWVVFTGKTESFGGDPITINYSYKTPKGYTTQKYESTTFNQSRAGIFAETGGGASKPGDVIVSVHILNSSEVANINGEKASLGGLEAKRLVANAENGSKLVTTNVSSIKTVEGETMGLRFSCSYFPKEGENIENTCDLITSTFKFL